MVEFSKQVLEKLEAMSDEEFAEAALEVLFTKDLAFAAKYSFSNHVRKRTVTK